MQQKVNNFQGIKTHLKIVDCNFFLFLVGYIQQAQGVGDSAKILGLNLSLFSKRMDFFFSTSDALNLTPYAKNSGHAIRYKVELFSLAFVIRIFALCHLGYAPCRWVGDRLQSS